MTLGGGGPPAYYEFYFEKQREIELRALTFGVKRKERKERKEKKPGRGRGDALMEAFRAALPRGPDARRVEAFRAAPAARTLCDGHTLPSPPLPPASTPRRGDVR